MCECICECVCLNGCAIVVYDRTMTKDLHDVNKLFECSFQQLRNFTKKVIDDKRVDERQTVESEMEAMRRRREEVEILRNAKKAGQDKL
eukprot:m.105099 g.105099  ORF g.105099 m.105099 type:complete len:89 (+) comp12649_c0_seq3:1703-1969(+)